MERVSLMWHPSFNYYQYPFELSKQDLEMKEKRELMISFKEPYYKQEISLQEIYTQLHIKAPYVLDVEYERTCVNFDIKKMVMPYIPVRKNMKNQEEIYWMDRWKQDYESKVKDLKHQEERYEELQKEMGELVYNYENTFSQLIKTIKELSKK